MIYEKPARKTFQFLGTTYEVIPDEPGEAERWERIRQGILRRDRWRAARARFWALPSVQTITGILWIVWILTAPMLIGFAFEWMLGTGFLNEMAKGF